MYIVPVVCNKVGDIICLSLLCKRVPCDHSFIVTNITIFCSFQKGDIFFVHNDMGDGWLWVTAHRTGEQGMIFRDLVDDLDENIDPNTVFSWFHPNVTKSEAVDMLVKGNVKCR